MNRIAEFLNFCANWHKNQVRKYTSDYYIRHCIEVATIIKNQGGSDVDICVALGHDLYEDTNCTHEQLLSFCKQIGFNVTESNKIHLGILVLTDLFTKENFYDFNRTARKKMQAQLLASCSNVVNTQSIKYADIISNTFSIEKYDSKFSLVYLKEKEYLLSICDKGDSYLLELAKRKTNPTTWSC